jgi:hypothetical protein
MSTKMAATIASDPQREDLFAELWHGDEQWAEIIRDPSMDALTIEIVALRSGGSYVFALADLGAALAEAKKRLKAPILHHGDPAGCRPDCGTQQKHRGQVLGYARPAR